MSSHLRQKIEKQRQKIIKEGIDNFWVFCKAIAPEFYNEDRPFLKDFTTKLQNVHMNKIVKENGEEYDGVVISFPPGHGKTFTIVLFSAWLLGRDSRSTIINVAYNYKLATQTSAAVRNIITGNDSLNDPKSFKCTDFFPEMTIDRTKSARDQWNITGRETTFLATGINGSITGFRANEALIIDDPIKNHEEAQNVNKLEEIWKYFTDTILSRRVNKTKVYVIQTRWNELDLAGRIMNGPLKDDFYALEYKAYDEEKDEMLCEEIMSKKRFIQMKNTTTKTIFEANYQQNINEVGEELMYEGLDNNFYDELNIIKFIEESNDRKSDLFTYVDTAKGGGDYFSAVTGYRHGNNYYIVDLIHNKDKLKENIKKLAASLTRHNVRLCIIESNSGGDSIHETLNEELKLNDNNTTEVSFLHQSKNKFLRIYNNAHIVSNNVFFPEGFDEKHREAWLILTGFKNMEKRNRYDDFPDSLTGLIETIREEYMNKSGQIKFEQDINISDFLTL